MYIDGHTLDFAAAEEVHVARERDPHAPGGVGYAETLYRMPDTGAWFRERILCDRHDYANYPRLVEYFPAEEAREWLTDMAPEEAERYSFTEPAPEPAPGPRRVPAGEARRYYLMRDTGDEDEVIDVYADMREAEEHAACYPEKHGADPEFFTTDSDYLLYAVLGRTGDSHEARDVLNDYAAEVGFSGRLGVEEAAQIASAVREAGDAAPARKVFEELQESEDTVLVTEKSWLDAYFGSYSESAEGLFEHETPYPRRSEE